MLAEVVAADPEIAELRERTRDLPEDAAYGERVRLGELVARALEDKREFDAELLLDASSRSSPPTSLRPVAGLEHVLDVALLVDDDRRAELRGAARGARRGGPRADPAAPGRARRAVRLRGGRLMGLITGLLGLPLAPLRGTLAAAEQIRSRPRRSSTTRRRIRAQLEEVDRQRAAGVLTEDEAAAWEDELVERLMVGRDRPPERS